MIPQGIRGPVGRLTIAIFLLAATVPTLPAFALQTAGGPGKWWQSERYTRELGLTAEQSRRLEEIFQAALPTLRSRKDSLDAAEREFERLVEHADDGVVMAQVDKVEMARAGLNKARTMMLLRMRRVLTSDQWVKLGALHQAEQAAPGTQPGTPR